MYFLTVYYIIVCYGLVHYNIVMCSKVKFYTTDIQMPTPKLIRKPYYFLYCLLGLRKTNFDSNTNNNMIPDRNRIMSSPRLEHPQNIIRVEIGWMNVFYIRHAHIKTYYITIFNRV